MSCSFYLVSHDLISSPLIWSSPKVCHPLNGAGRFSKPHTPLQYSFSFLFAPTYISLCLFFLFLCLSFWFFSARMILILCLRLSCSLDAIYRSCYPPIRSHRSILCQILLSPVHAACMTNAYRIFLPSLRTLLSSLMFSISTCGVSNPLSPYNSCRSGSHGITSPHLFVQHVVSSAQGPTVTTVRSDTQRTHSVQAWCVFPTPNVSLSICFDLSLSPCLLLFSTLSSP